MESKEIMGTWSEKSAAEVWNFLNKQIDLLHKTKKIVLEQKEEPWITIHPLIHAVIESSSSILTLAQDNKLRDCYALGRVVLETIINIGFIYAKGKESAEQMQKHAIQKEIRGYERESKIGDMILKIERNPKIDLSQDEELMLAVEAFTGKKGQELTKWTPEGIIKRLEVINSEYGKKIAGDLHFALISIYRNASEVIHGTYYGSLFSIGGISLPKTREELTAYIRSSMSLLLMMLGASSGSLIRIISKEIQIETILKDSESVTNSFLEYIKPDLFQK